MQFALTEEQALVAQTVRGQLTEFAPSLRATIDSADGFDRGHWQALVGEMGLGGLAVDPSHGGSGLGMIEQALVMEEMGRTLLPSPFLPSIATALPLLAAAGEERWIAPIARGETIAAVLFGTSGLVPFGHVADIFVLVSGDRVAVVPRDAATVTRHPTMDVTRPLATVTIDARAETVPVDALAALDRARVALAAECVGGADAILDRTVDYAKTRIQFGRPIGSFQAIKHRLADMMIALEAARTAVWYAAAAIDEADAQAEEAALIAHATAIETYRMVAGHAIQLHGGIGFTWEHDAHLFFKRARSAGTLLGTPEQSRERLARLIGLDEAA